MHAAIIIFCGLAVYSNSIKGQFLWDDDAFIKDNNYVKQWRYLPKLFTDNVMERGVGKRFSFYRPIQMISYMADHSFWGLKPAGYHITNIILHVATALLVYFLVLLLFKDSLISLVTGLLFVVHPAHTGAVASISGRADPLAGAFFLGALILYIKNTEKSRKSRGILTVLLFSAALLSRENALVLPVVMLLYNYSFGKKINARLFTPVLAAACIYIFLRLAIINIFLPHSLSGTTLLQRFPGFLAALASYLRLLIIPLDLHMVYGMPTFAWSDPGVLAGFSILALSAAATYWASKKDRAVLFSLLWFFILLLPQSNLYPLNAYMAEHWLYLPSIGIFILAARGAVILFKKEKLRPLIVSGVASLLLIYSWFTISQNVYWQDPERFYKKTLEYSPDNEWLYNNLGNVYCHAGRIDEAIAAYQKALAISPGLDSASYNLANAYAAAGRKKEAIALLEKVVKANPYYVNAYNNLGVLYIDAGMVEDAIAAYTAAIKIKPDYAEAYYNLGLAYNSLGKDGEAALALRKSVELEPGRAEFHINAGNVFYAGGDYEDAIASYKKAIDSDDKRASAYNNLGIAYRDTKRYDLARRAFEDAIRRNPALPDAFDNLGVEYARAGRDREAIDMFRRAISLAPGFANAYANLGTAYLKTRRQAEAIDSYGKALEIEPGLGVAHKNLSVIYFQMGDYKEAIMHCDKALESGLAVEPGFLEKINEQRGR